MTYSTQKAQQFAARSSDKKSMFPRAARIFVGVEVVFGVAYFLLPPSALRAATYSVVSLGMVVAILVGVRRWKPAQPMAWYLIAAGQLLFSIGDGINYYREWVLKTEIPFPSVGDGLYLIFYPLLAAGLLLLVRGPGPGTRRGQPDRRHHHHHRYRDAVLGLPDRAVRAPARPQPGPAPGVDRLPAG